MVPSSVLSSNVHRKRVAMSVGDLTKLTTTRGFAAMFVLIKNLFSCFLQGFSN